MRTRDTRIIIIINYTVEHAYRLRIVLPSSSSSRLLLNNSSIRRRFTSRGTLSVVYARDPLLRRNVTYLIPFITISAAFVHTDSSGDRLQNSAAYIRARCNTRNNNRIPSPLECAKTSSQIAQSQQVSEVQGG